MIGIFCCMIGYLTYGTEKCTTNDGASAHVCGCVYVLCVGISVGGMLG